MPKKASQQRASNTKSTRKNQPREHRINRIAAKLALRFRVSKDRGKSYRVLVRKERKRAKLVKLIAYDFETTRIAVGTPRPLYITAYGDNGAVNVSEPVTDAYDVLRVLNESFLTIANNKARFVAWNGNGFDAYLIAMAVLHSKDYIIRPYLTRSKALRGLKIIPTDPILAKSMYWEFVDGIAMLGMVGTSLDAFLKRFAPDFQKLDAPDWENEEFDPTNRAHVEYAERDSEGLYHGMLAAQSIVVDHFNIGLSGTIGNMGIKIFQSFIPEQVRIKQPCLELSDIIKKSVMRGGYCHSVRKYHGPVWKYDLNQAYAAAMRESKLPCGDAYKIPGVSKYASCFVARITATHAKNKVPFYYRSIDDQKSYFATDRINDTWITSIEYRQLLNEGWAINVRETWNWPETFDMRDYVNKLEYLRINAPGGVASPQGLMMKAIGNNSYGKTVEQLDGLELIMANEQPEGYAEYYNDDEKLSHIWFKFGEPSERDYHQPQIGSFITAHVRMVVRRAALQNPDAWIYADTDCVVFTEYVPLDCDAKKYGKWKVEAENDEQIYIGKKIYTDIKGESKHAKGLNRKRLSVEDFRLWFAGVAPIQTQTQKQNFVKVMAGANMFAERTKRGQIKTI